MSRFAAAALVLLSAAATVRGPADAQTPVPRALEDWQAKEGLLAAIFIDFLRRAQRH